MTIQIDNICTIVSERIDEAKGHNFLGVVEVYFRIREAFSCN